LLAGVFSPEFALPGCLKSEYVLRATDYAVNGLPDPDDRDVPIDTGDFETSPATGTAEDDIPF
jgi:hypothetical protein